VVAHICDPSYLGGGGKRIAGLRPAVAKVGKALFQEISQDVMAHACDPS
jgi:hypothetical protein